MIPDLIVKTTVLLGLAWIAALLLHRRAASTRHAVWAGLLAATLLLPLMVSLAPSIDVPVLPAATSAEPIARTTPIRVAPNELAIATDRGGTRDARSRVMLPERSAATQQQVPLTEPSILTPRTLLLGAWLLVAFALAVRIGLAHLQARKLLRSCEAPGDRLVRAAASVAATLGIKTPAVRIAPAGLMPAVIGLRNPAIVLPAEASSWTGERLEVVLLHECAHVRRRDAAMQLISGLATAAYWWHPLAWIAARQMVRERELACDDMVIASGTPAHRYADHLLDIARSLKSSRQPALAALTMARPSQLEGRLMALLDNRPRDSRPARALALGLLLAVGGLFAIAPLKLVARTAAAAENVENVNHSGTPIAEQAQAVTASQAPAPAPAPADLSAAYQKDARLFEALMKALKDMDADVRTAAVRAVATTAEVEKVLALLAPLVEDVSADVRAAVVQSLGRNESPQAADLLVKALADADPDVRQMALRGLVRLQNESVIPHLAAALKDASEDVRAVAVIGIDNLDHPQKRALLLQSAADASEDVRALVALALADQADADVRATLAKLAQDVSADVRQAAVMAIASQARRADVDQLLASLADRDEDVRAAAAIALGSIADKVAMAGLTRALKDGEADVRSAAAIALGSIGDTAALQALTAAVADVDADVRRAAITAAASIGGDAQAHTVIASTIAGTVAGTIAGTLQGTLWGGAEGYAGRARPESRVEREAHDQNPPAAATADIKGYVKNPGTYPWTDELTVGKLVAMAGGLSERGTMRGIRIERRQNGNIITIDAGETTRVREHDTVVVPRRRF